MSGDATRPYRRILRETPAQDNRIVDAVLILGLAVVEAIDAQTEAMVTAILAPPEDPPMVAELRRQTEAFEAGGQR